MSALVAIFGLQGEQQHRQADDLVSAGLAVQDGRAPGPVEIATLSGAVLGVRGSIPLSSSGGDGARSARRVLAEGSVSIAISGFIDNGPELLDITAAAAQTTADALLELYLARGVEFIEAVGGSFAIALWDERTRAGYLFRDRLGVEPLYFHVAASGGRLVASSEPKGLLADPTIPRRFDLAALPDLLNSSSRTPGSTVYSDIWEVRPGELLGFRDGRITQRAYWRLPKTLVVPSEREATEAVDELLASAVHRRTGAARQGSDAGFLLSGGLDSSLICAIASSGADQPIDTYSFSYEDSKLDFEPDALHVSLDEPFVDIMVEHIGSRHNALTVRNERFRESLRETVRARDLPGVGDLDIALLRILKRVAEDKAVVFSGEAADDVFGGYPWFSHEFGDPGTTFPWLRGSAASDLLRDDIRHRLALDDIISARYDATVAEAQPLQGREGAEAHLRGVFWAEITRFLPFLLDRVDRMAAAAGVRVMLPFTDHRLVEYAWDLPYALKSTGGIEKGLLRRAGAHRLPQSVASRRKSGFAVGKSPAYRLAIGAALTEMLSRDSVVWRIADRDRVRSLLASAAWSDGTFSGPPILPRLVLLDLWCTEYAVSFVH